MKSFITENYDKIIGYLFGGGGILAFFSSRRKSKLDAFQQMQKGYKDFIEDSNKRFDDLQKLVEDQNKELELLRPLKSQVETLSKELHSMRLAYESEKQKNALCKRCKNKM